MEAEKMMFSPIIKVSDATTYPLPMYYDIAATTTVAACSGGKDLLVEYGDEREELRKKISMEMGKISNRLYYENLTRVMARRSIGKVRAHRPRNDGRNDKFGFKRRS
jgi:hypothetical protein